MAARTSLRIRLGAEAIALRLGLVPMVARRSLPELLARLTPSRPPSPPAPREAVDEALARAERIFERAPWVPDTCLYRSLARYALLCRAGYAARFVMGIEPRADPNAEIRGHAWVELDGVPYAEEVDEGMIVTYAYPCLRSGASPGSPGCAPKPPPS
ncbi:lasso peptide biosynthesis B2 protein [Polyangium aurulentum]|uniref:lasso peptide biosynthesis B2 protein n=1 Tax=Polyangium aurulentum TaxID=2567896 RepID=UPI0010AE8056|nr:lasso peptide biosynthesis B2 protein [Polyangium aurulentum]UQA55309.1 lasso peptide biosynthesis B2 protein [Polyangium aurulentum]